MLFVLQDILVILFCKKIPSCSNKKCPGGFTDKSCNCSCIPMEKVSGNNPLTKRIRFADLNERTQNPNILTEKSNALNIILISVSIIFVLVFLFVFVYKRNFSRR